MRRFKRHSQPAQIAGFFTFEIFESEILLSGGCVYRGFELAIKKPPRRVAKIAVLLLKYDS